MKIQIPIETTKDFGFIKQEYWQSHGISRQAMYTFRERLVVPKQSTLEKLSKATNIKIKDLKRLFS